MDSYCGVLVRTFQFYISSLEVKTSWNWSIFTEEQKSVISHLVFLPSEGKQEWNFVKCCLSACFLFCPLPVISPCFLTLDLAMPVAYLEWTFDTAQTSQGTSGYPLHNLKECSCWTLIREALVWVRRVRMCLWGKGRIENHWRRGDSNFSQPLSPSQHCRKSLCTLECTTAHSHAPAQTTRQTNRRDRALLALIKELAGCNLALYN